MAAVFLAGALAAVFLAGAFFAVLLAAITASSQVPPGRRPTIGRGSDGRRSVPVSPWIRWDPDPRMEKPDWSGTAPSPNQEPSSAKKASRSSPSPPTPPTDGATG